MHNKKKIRRFKNELTRSFNLNPLSNKYINNRGMLDLWGPFRRFLHWGELAFCWINLTRPIKSKANRSKKDGKPELAVNQMKFTCGLLRLSYGQRMLYGDCFSIAGIGAIKSWQTHLTSLCLTWNQKWKMTNAIYGHSISNWFFSFFELLILKSKYKLSILLHLSKSFGCDNYFQKKSAATMV